MPAVDRENAPIMHRTADLPRSSSVPGRLLAVVGLVLLAVTHGCGEGPQEPPRPAASAQQAITLAIGAFSAMREAFGSRLLPAFGLQWRRQHGQEVQFEERYEGSETLTRAIAGGLSVDVGVFALSRDVDSLVASGLVDPGWREAPHRGIVSRSLVVLAVRKGNPKGIRDWADLARPGVRIVMPDPDTSGGGIWYLCAVYGAALRGHAGVQKGDPATARDFVARVLANVVERRPNSAESFRLFQSGSGDVAITYESDLALGWMFGHEEERVIPTSTVLVEHPAVVIGRHADAHAVRPAAEGLLAFLWTTEAQKVIAFCGLRPVDAAVAADSAGQFPVPEDLWTIEDLGGWEQLTRDLLVPAGFAGRPPK
jgi:sulfate transport system substrate-binding protein